MEAIRGSRLSSPLPILSTAITSYRSCLTVILRVQELYPCRYPEMAFDGKDLAHTVFSWLWAEVGKLRVRGVQDQ